MSKGLPYFKFYVNTWITGTITSLPFATQGVYVNILSWYWSKECEFFYSDLIKKFPKKQVEKLISVGVLKKSDDKVEISFLKDQLNDKKSLSKTNSLNGSNGGRSKSYGKNKKANAFTGESNIEDIRGEEKREEEIRGVFFRINDLVYPVKLSQFFVQEFPGFYDQWLMKNDPELAADVFEKMDTDYHGYTFSDHNHIQNTFKSVWAKVSKPEKIIKDQPNKIEQTLSAYEQAKNEMGI